jgi:acyl carrier protein
VIRDRQIRDDKIRGAAPMTTVDRLKRILRDALDLAGRADTLTQASGLLGAIPELDSMAVVTVLTMIEDEFGITVGDDEVSAAVFETLGTLATFVDEKVAA